jgi:hypothetical protein
MNVTKEQLLRFVKIRNASGFSSNLQFGIDAQEAGFDVKELGTPERGWHAPEREDEGGYRWQTAHGTLVELPGGEMELREDKPTLCP